MMGVTTRECRENSPYTNSVHVVHMHSISIRRTCAWYVYSAHKRTAIHAAHNHLNMWQLVSNQTICELQLWPPLNYNRLYNSVAIHRHIYKIYSSWTLIGWHTWHHPCMESFLFNFKMQYLLNLKSDYPTIWSYLLKKMCWTKWDPWRLCLDIPLGL